MAAKQPKTSITITTADSLLKKSDRSTLSCTRITGFHLLNLKHGAAWRYRYTNESGNRRIATIGKYPGMLPEVAAEQALNYLLNNSDPLSEKQAQRQQARSAEEATEARKFSNYLENEYAAHQSRKKTGNETLAIIRHNFPEWAERDMATMSTTDVQEWQKRRESEGTAHATLKRAYGAVKTMFNHAAKPGGKNDPPPLLDENPIRNVSLDDPVDNKRNQALVAARESARRLLTDDEIQALHTGLALFADDLRRKRRNSRAHGKPHLPDLDELEFPHWFIPFCNLALFTGMRPGDIYSLTWAEANLNFGKITKTPEKTRHHDNPAKIVIDMADPLKEVLKGWHRQQGKPQAGLVFPSPMTGKRLDQKAHRKPWKNVKTRGDLPDDLVFYALRHHFISTLVANGVPLLTVARLVGQKSAQMIESHYGHLSPSSAASALNLFARSVERKAVVNE
jgi:integrase